MVKDRVKNYYGYEVLWISFFGKKYHGYNIHSIHTGTTVVLVTVAIFYHVTRSFFVIPKFIIGARAVTPIFWVRAFVTPLFCHPIFGKDNKKYSIIYGVLPPLY